MKKPLRISIPSPCHENWANMTPSGKGRFCASCQKSVVDFSKSSDREIADFYNKNKDACGLFLETQLNRDLIIPNKKVTPLWVVASAAAISFLSLGTGQASAQTTPDTEQSQANPDKPMNITLTGYGKTITGIVVDKYNRPAPGVTVKVRNTKTEVITNEYGEFTIEAGKGDVLKLSGENFSSQKIEVTGDTSIRIQMKFHRRYKPPVIMGRFF